MNATDRAKVLARSAVFAEVPPAHLAVLAEMMLTETFASGTVVIEAGEPAECVYVVSSGGLSVRLPGRSEVVRQLGQGDVVGEYGMLDAAVRTATVQVDSDAVLLSLDYERFREYLLRFPDALWVLFAGAVRRLAEAETRLRTG